jgi:hypothetical protein
MISIITSYKLYQKALEIVGELWRYIDLGWSIPEVEIREQDRYLPQKLSRMSDSLKRQLIFQNFITWEAVRGSSTRVLSTCTATNFAAR